MSDQRPAVDTPAGARLRIGTRASALALAQSGQVGARIAAAMPGGAEVELVHVSTHGDRDRRSALAQIGGTGVFVTAVREALLAGEVDVIVHSAKDLPTAPAEGIALACIPVREDVRDALCAPHGWTLESLPHGASVGTGSPRRAAQLLRARPDLHVVGIRGNIDTRLARALGAEADLDAVVLAAAGLRRLSREDAISELLDPDVMLPAPAQGALAVECRREEVERGTELARALAAVDDPATRAAVTAERALLRALEAGCSAPVAALGSVDGDELRLRGLAIPPDGARVFAGSRDRKLGGAGRWCGSEGRDAADVGGSVDDRDSEEPTRLAADLGAQLAADLLAQGAGDVLAGIGATVADTAAARKGAAVESGVEDPA